MSAPRLHLSPQGRGRLPNEVTKSDEGVPELSRDPNPLTPPLSSAGRGADRACRANCTSTGRELGRDYREKQGPASPNSHRREDVRELGLEPRAEIVAHVDRDREGPFELHVVGDAGVDQDAVVE